MKRVLFFILLTAILAVVTTQSASAQSKPFKGVITFAFSYSGDIDAATIAQAPKLMTMFVLGNKTKTQMIQGPVTIEVVLDGDAKTKTVLLDIMGQKKYYKQPKEDLDKNIEESKPEITYTEETKTIAGYVCYKAIAVSRDEDDNETKIIVWYNTELGGEAVNYGDQFHGLKGMPMEYEIESQGIVTKISATEVKKGKVKETDFLIPADYSEMTPEEKQQIMQME